ncbi:unnamed protein product [Victoria cruziana]
MAGSTGSLLALLLLLLLYCAISEKNVYIVYMGGREEEDPNVIQDSHHEILSDVLGSKEGARESILYSYKHGFSGFAALLTPSQARLIEEYTGVVRVMPHRILNLHTTRSWDFLGLNFESVHGILLQSKWGDGSIIGVLDTGIWPESESFKEDGVGEVPLKWKGVCQEGEQFNSSNCNRKIIGARWYVKGYNAEVGKLNTGGGVEFLSPRDALGHGTHTSSTAAGAFVRNASFMGLAQGIARGGAPLARLAVYKVCWATGGCSSADILAAFDDAIFDGVDILSISLGSSPPLSPYVDDALAVGSFHAVTKGVTVVCSAGNFGPYSQSVINGAPWMLTVAAATIDRLFPTAITLGNNQTLVGQALYVGKHRSRDYGMVFSEDIALGSSDNVKARSCETGSLNATLAENKVVLCFQSRLQRSLEVAISTVVKVKGAGIVFAKFPTKVTTTSLSIPSVQVDIEIGTRILSYIRGTRNPTIRFSHTKTVLGTTMSPEIAFFSSRGPSSLSPAILKPDVAAPGVNILASWSPASKLEKSGHQVHLNFKLESGTSMACPHVSGIAALLRSLHPDWSPAAIKSAIVTTATIKDEYGQRIVEEGAPHKPADPFDYGGGHVNPNRAADPGLVYDTSISDYISFLCNMGYNSSAITLMTRRHTPCGRDFKLMENLNLPSISIPNLSKRLRVFRTVSNVGDINAVYTAEVESPNGVDVSVKPHILSFNSTVRKLTYSVTFKPLIRVQGRYAFGSLTWKDGFHTVRIPIAVRVVIHDFYADMN